MRALVVGMDGSLGRALLEELAAQGLDVVGTTRKPVRQRQQIFLDLAAPEALHWQPPAVDVAIFSAAVAKFAECRQEPARAHRVNVSSPVAIARRLVSEGSRVILLSTSAVYPGHRPHVPADEAPAPLSVYGKLKAEAEEQFCGLGEIASIVRLTKIITSELQLLRDWVSGLRQGEAIRAFSDLTVSPITLDHAIICLSAIVKNPEGGMYQISGADDVPYTEIAQHLARRAGASADLVRSCRALDQGVPLEEIPRFTSLDALRVTELTERPPQPWRHVVNRVYEEIIKAMPAT